MSVVFFFYKCERVSLLDIINFYNLLFIINNCNESIKFFIQNNYYCNSNLNISRISNLF